VKWIPVAAAVIDRLSNARLIANPPATELRRLIRRRAAVDAFRLSHRLMTEPGWLIGWNKIRRGNSAYGWYGPTVTIHPLRSAALEIETDAELWNSCRRLLTSLHRQQEKPDPAEFHPLTYPVIQAFGVNARGNNLDRPGIELLQRLNLDCRESPLAERIHWSGNSCLIVLSDGGRFQITRELAWARAIESGIGSDGRMNPQVRALLTGIDAGSSEIILPRGGIEDATASFMSILSRYRFAAVETDRMSLAVQAGGFPALALEIWD